VIDLKEIKPNALKVGEVVGVSFVVVSSHMGYRKREMVNTK